MTHFSRLLLSGTATLALLLSACQGKSSDVKTEKAPAVKMAADASKDEMIMMMKDAMAQAQATSGGGSPAMWRFSDDDTTVYMLGTVHLLKPDVEWRSPAIDSALSAADTLIFEADTTSPESLANMQKLAAEYGAFGEGQSLTAVLDDDEEATLSTALQGIGATLQQVDKAKPWMISLQLGMMQIMQAGYDIQSGVEAKLMASAGDKKISYLETAEAQMKAIGGAPIDEQVQGLMAALSTLELGEEYLDMMVAEWADGDVKGIGAMLANPAAFGTQNSYDALLTQRNKNWIPGIKALLDEPGTKLVAVGAAHLAGPDSVVGMLKNEGIKVKAVQ